MALEKEYSVEHPKVGKDCVFEIKFLSASKLMKKYLGDLTKNV